MMQMKTYGLLKLFDLWKLFDSNYLTYENGTMEHNELEWDQLFGM